MAALVTRALIEKALRYEELYLEMKALEEEFTEHCKKTFRTFAVGNFSAKYRAAAGKNDWEAAIKEAGIMDEQLEQYKEVKVSYDYKQAAIDAELDAIYTPGIGDGSVSFSVKTE